jgi:amino acid transporter
MLVVLEKIKRLLVGNPLESKRERHERLPIPLALAVFASDALSSTAYATEEILLALILSGFALQANALSLPVAIAILLLITVVVISYRQVIRAYPEGGGAYIVSRENLGELASLIAGGALLIDYVLTVAVSLSGGVAAITSFRMADNTSLVSQEYSVPLALLFLIIMILVNLRGVRESGKVLAVPAYLFLLAMFALIGYGMFRIFTGDVPASVQMDMAAGKSGAADINWMDMAVVMVMLKAFSHGCSALTGIEAISNGVKAFKSPVDMNANRTMAIMGGLLGIIFTGVTYVAYAFHVQPGVDHETHAVTQTAISLVNAAVFGEGSIMYTVVQILTMVILILAANTSFAGFPRLANLLADDGYLPRQLMSLGDRLVFSNGIMILGVTSAILIAAFNANTHYLMPLYAVGVFLSFTLAQTGMFLHHLKHKGKDWQVGAYICGFGALVTGFVTVLLTVEKFMEGAGIVVIAIPALIYVFMSIKNHYKTIAKELTLGESVYCPLPIEHTVLVLVSSLNKGTIPALEYARTISDRVEAVHVELNPIATERLKKSWDEWGCGVTLTILKSPYRSITEPILQYVEEVESRYDHDLVTIIIPEFVTKKFWHNILHNQTSFLIKALLRMKTGKVVTTVRYYLQN